MPRLLAPIPALILAGCGVTRPHVEPATKAAPLATLSRPVLALSAGDVTASRAVVWARTDGYAALHVELSGGRDPARATTWAVSGHDFTAKVVFAALQAGTRYEYRAWFSTSDAATAVPNGAATGAFQTPPAPDRMAPVTFGWSGDLAGLGVCRDVKEGYPIFRTLDGRGLDFFIGLGDIIYGDQPCDARGFYGNEQVPMAVREASTLRDYWEHWKYNHGDPGFLRLLRSTGYYAVWDDHEVVNDFAPTDAWHRFPPYTIGADLVPLGRQALFDENPILEEPGVPTHQYRSYRWGKHVELIVLDTRSYRDEDQIPDSFEHPKTMLGKEQREWFEHLVTTSDATWKIVVSSVPISIPTGRGGEAGRDGWANYDTPAGFEQELTGIFSAFRAKNERHVVFITTDVHFATAFRYRPFGDDFVVHEVTAGPLNAMLLPTHALDETFHPERLFFFGPDGQAKDYAEAKRFMNWGKIAVAADGALTVTIVDGLGAEAARVDLPR